MINGEKIELENQEHVPKSIQKELNNRMDQIEGRLKKVVQLQKALLVALGVKIGIDGDKIAYAVDTNPETAGILGNLCKEIGVIQQELSNEPRIIRPH